MLLIIQFPIVDLRGFLETNTEYLNYPVWPIPEQDKDFIRNFGSIRKRWRGGLSGWLSEDAICEADRALRFQKRLHFNTSEITNHDVVLPFKIAFRRFYFDGLAVGKFEVGIKLQIWKIFANNTLRHIEAVEVAPNKLIEETFKFLLTTPVSIPNPTATSTDCILYDSGKSLAFLYLLSSSVAQSAETQLANRWWVQACKPIMFLSQDDLISFDIPFLGKSISLDEHICGKISHHLISFRGESIRLWNYEEEYKEEDAEDRTKPQFYETESSKRARHLRIHLLRLHAEKQCLRTVLENVATGRISPPPRSDASDNLQNYLNTAISRISRLESHGNELIKSNINILAHTVEDKSSPGDVDAILAALQKLRIRPNIYRKTQSHIEQLHIEVNYIMGDKNINRGQAGIVGSHGHAHDMNFNQAWNEVRNEIDFSALANELSILREKIKEEAKGVEQDVIIGEIAAAELAAKKEDEPTVLKHLQKTGKWTFDTATKISIPVAIAALKAALGL